MTTCLIFTKHQQNVEKVFTGKIVFKNVITTVNLVTTFMGPVAVIVKMAGKAAIAANVSFKCNNSYVLMGRFVASSYYILKNGSYVLPPLMCFNI